MSEEKHHHHFFHHLFHLIHCETTNATRNRVIRSADLYAAGEVKTDNKFEDYEKATKEKKHHNLMEELGGLGAMAAGAFAFIRSLTGVFALNMSEEKQHHHYHHVFHHLFHLFHSEISTFEGNELIESADVYAAGGVKTDNKFEEYQKAKKEGKHQLGGLGAVAAGAFALHEKHEEKKDPERAHRHKIEEEIAEKKDPEHMEHLGEMGAVAAGAFALHEKHAEKKDPEHMEHLGEMGAVAAGAFALQENHAEKKDPEQVRRHEIEEEVA